MAWRSTPKQKLILAERFDRTTGTWSECQYRDLKRGDIFRSMWNGEKMSYLPEVPDDGVVGIKIIDDADVLLCTDDAIPNRYLGHGYCVEVISGPFDDILKMSTH